MQGTVAGYFDDFEAGMQFTSLGRTVTEADIVNFAGLSGDFNAIHTDAEVAAAGDFGQRIAHGMLVLSIATGLATQLGVVGDKVRAFLGLEWKFRNPVFIGDTIRVELTVANLREARRMGGGLLTFDVKVLNQKDETTQKGSWTLLLQKRPSG
ncbi:MAG: MaoC family dehydratase N-terminal domain-containing protein [Anaerolineales bacterium]|nr:MaoC family dehydratase N-terminal domain-containing protein [Anaerolineales bacterium]MCB9126456.1 MaoC family dehydratase N-terminal domain-containing protein [Ardenticatenales bacterium]MCB9171616.1 MaoC family dehydratase N-terminal domain-containing protein [Ardenticatenales bacterium]